MSLHSEDMLSRLAFALTPQVLSVVERSKKYQFYGHQLEPAGSNPKVFYANHYTTDVVTKNLTYMLWQTQTLKVPVVLRVTYYVSKRVDPFTFLAIF